MPHPRSNCLRQTKKTQYLQAREEEPKRNKRETGRYLLLYRQQKNPQVLVPPKKHDKKQQQQQQQQQQRLQQQQIILVLSLQLIQYPLSPPSKKKRANERNLQSSSPSSPYPTIISAPSHLSKPTNTYLAEKKTNSGDQTETAAALQDGWTTRLPLQSNKSADSRG